MAAVKLEQYLTSIIDATKADTNEVRLRPGNRDLGLLTVSLENRNAGLHRYQTANTTILYAAEGTIKVRINDQDYWLTAGNIVFLQKKCSYEVQKQEDANLLIKLEFSPRFNPRFLSEQPAQLGVAESKTLQEVSAALAADRFLYLNSSAVSVAAQLVKRVINEYLNHNLFARGTIIAELDLLFVTAIRSQNLVTGGKAGHKFVASALEQYIDANFTRITLDETARHFGFNPNYFSSLVKQKTGKSFVEHVDERRMEEARNLLARPDISVKEIISRVGYSGKSFFYKKFNEYYHETPVQMRAELFRQANINLK